jgi:hypothetical protein
VIGFMSSDKFILEPPVFIWYHNKTGCQDL